MAALFLQRRPAVDNGRLRIVIDWHSRRSGDVAPAGVTDVDLRDETFQAVKSMDSVAKVLSLWRKRREGVI